MPASCFCCFSPHLCAEKGLALNAHRFLLEQNIKKRDEKQKAQAEHIASLREKKKALAKALFTANADLVKYTPLTFLFHLIFIDRLIAP